MQTRHKDRQLYFSEQIRTTEKYIIPYIEKVLPVQSGLSVIEIGCGEGGNLKPFLDRGCRVIGIDLASNKIANAKKFFSDHPSEQNIQFIAENVYNLNPDQMPPADLIILRDTIEHIPDQDLFLNHLKGFIKPEGKIFISFPPWRMPFGGHQQMCASRFLSKLPWFHILPSKIYAAVLKAFGEDEIKIKDFLDIQKTRLSITRFRSITRKNQYQTDDETVFLINPGYEAKFNLKPVQWPKWAVLPFFTDFMATAYYCMLSARNE